MPSDIEGEVQITIYRDLRGVGPREGLPVSCDAASAGIAPHANAILNGLITFLLVAPLLLMLLPGNRRKAALWILLPHGLWAIGLLAFAPLRGSQAIAYIASAPFALTSLWLLAAILEGRNRFLAALIWLLMWAVGSALGVAAVLIGNSVGGTANITHIFGGFSLPAACAFTLVFVFQGFWMRWRHRWWLFLLVLPVSTGVAVALAQGLTLGFLVTSGSEIADLILSALNPSTVVRMILVGTLVLCVAVLPHLVLALACPFYRRRMFAVYRRPGAPTPEGCEDWRDFERQTRARGGRAGAPVVLTALVALLLAILFVPGRFADESAAEAGEAEEEATALAIGPDTPVEKQGVGPQIPRLPDDGITSTTYPTAADAAGPALPQ